MTGSPGVFNSHSCWWLWASRNSSITVQHPATPLPPHTQVLRPVSLMNLCSGKLWWLVFTCLSLLPWEQWFALCPPFSYRSKKSCWFFCLFSPLLLRMDWWLPSSLHAESYSVELRWWMQTSLPHFQSLKSITSFTIKSDVSYRFFLHTFYEVEEFPI